MTQNLLIYLNHDLIDFGCIKKLDMTELTGIKDRAGSLNESDF